MSKQIIVTLRDDGQVYHGEMYIGTLSNPDAVPEAKLQETSVIELAKMGYTAQDLVDLKRLDII